MRSASIISNSAEAPQSFELCGFFLWHILANLKGAEDEGFIYPITQFLQENWYIKPYIRYVNEKGPPHV